MNRFHPGFWVLVLITLYFSVSKEYFWYTKRQATSVVLADLMPRPAPAGYAADFKFSVSRRERLGIPALQTGGMEL